MVLGLRSKNRRASSIQVDYTIHIQEIKPWPPSQSLKSLRSVVLQWANGDRNSGSTTLVAPSIAESKIEFNESFKLQVTLLKEKSGKSNDIQKNALELNLYEPRRDKTVKGQLLGSAVVDLAEYGIVKGSVTFGVPLNCKRSYRNTAAPVVYGKIHAFDRESPSTSSRGSLSKEASLDKDGRESVSALMSEEYAEEAEIASFTDDDVDIDVSSRSSRTNSSSNFEASADAATRSSCEELANHKNESEAVKESGGAAYAETNLVFDTATVNPKLEPVTDVPFLDSGAIRQNRSLPESLPTVLSIDAEAFDNHNASSSHISHKTSVLIAKKSDSCTAHPSSSFVTDEGLEEETRFSSNNEGVEKSNFRREVQEKMVTSRGKEEAVIKNDPTSIAEVAHRTELPNAVSTAEPEHCTDDKKSDVSEDGFDGVGRRCLENGSEGNVKEVQNDLTEIESSTTGSPDNGSIASLESMDHTPIIRQHNYIQNALKKPVDSQMTVSDGRILGEKGSNALRSDRVKNMRFSMRSPPHLLGSIRYAASDQYIEDVKEIDVLEDVCNGSIKSFTRDGVDKWESINVGSGKSKHVSRSNGNNNVPSKKIRELELRVEMLEGELRETAAVEIGLYSIVAEHGSSLHKVHTPARRLSRLYIHASKQSSSERKANAAKSAVSGLVLVAKACGNDVPRLTFWLSNSIVLRAIVTQAIGHSDFPSSAGSSPAVAKGTYSPLKWESPPPKKEKFSSTEEFEDWEDLYTFTAALERIESWIFSRIIESIWWQTLTPHMQSINEGGEPNVHSHKKKNYGMKLSLGDQQQTNLSIEIWKKAFVDAYERLCPLRSEGHECGCLPMLARLVMEQCVARLDVAMFNAILRESDDEIPTDPVSDPISDPRVLPIPPGKSSFGAGAQLKNAIGNWSRWLTDLFGMDADDSPRNKNKQDDDRLDVAESLKSFRLLNALSDLLMLPKDMLLEKSIRKEVCPTFSTLMIKQILRSFSPDEFCPDRIPNEVVEALDSEEPLDSNEEGIRNFPCSASPISYSPPSVSSVGNIIGDVRSKSLLRRSRSSVVRKCHTSDDELDELDSPLSSIFIESSCTPNAKSKGNSSPNAVRYQLLRDVWRNDD